MAKHEELTENARVRVIKCEEDPSLLGREGRLLCSLELGDRTEYVVELAVEMLCDFYADELELVK